MAQRESSTVWVVLELAGTIGFTIAVPLVFFALVGRWMDRQYDTSPLFLLSGIILSLVITTVALARKMGDFQRIITTTDGQKQKGSGQDADKSNSANSTTPEHRSSPDMFRHS